MKLKYKGFSLVMSLFMLFAAGCGKSSNPPVITNEYQGRTFNVGEGTAPAESVVSDLKIEGDIKNIHYAHKNKILITANKQYIYDVGTKNVLLESPRTEAAAERLWTIDSGYAAVREAMVREQGGSSMTAGGSSYKIVFYDDNLKKVSEFDLNSLMEDDEMLMSLQAISFSSNGTRMAYATYTGVYIYDFEKKTKATVLDLSNADTSKRSGIVNIEQVGFTNQDKVIAFKAQSYDVPADPEKASFDTCGYISIDGSGLSNRTFDTYTCKRLTAYDHHLLFAEDPTNASGRTLVMEMPHGKTKIHSQVERNESGNVWGSDRGGYFATSVPDKTGWTIRIYHTETGKLEAEQHISIDGEKRYMEHDPVIKVLDDARTCMVLLGAVRDDIQSKMIISRF